MTSGVRMCPPNARLQKPSSKGQEKGPVCRSLFGPVDHKLTEKFLAQELARIFQSSARDWNFDFSVGVPLPSKRFLWESCPGLDASHQRSCEESMSRQCEDVRRDLFSSDLRTVGSQSRQGKSRNVEVLFKTQEEPEFNSKQPTLKDFLPVTKKYSTTGYILRKRKISGKSARRRTFRRKRAAPLRFPGKIRSDPNDRT